jgi:hypothetical protein
MVVLMLEAWSRRVCAPQTVRVMALLAPLNPASVNDISGWVCTKAP